MSAGPDSSKNSDKATDTSGGPNKPTDKSPEAAPTASSEPSKDAKAQPVSKSDSKSDKKPDAKAEAPMKRQSESQPSESGKASGSGIAPVLWMVIFAAVLIGGAYASLPIWGPKIAAYLPGGQSDPTTQNTLRDLAQRLKDLESVNGSGDALDDLQAQREAVNGQLKTLVDRVGELEKALADVRKMAEVASPTAGAAATDSLQKISSRLSSLEENQDALDTILKRIADLEVQTQGVDPEVAEKIAAMQNRLGAIETTDQRAQRGQALVLAIGQVRDSVDRSQPFVEEVDALSAVAGDGPEFKDPLATLKAHAPAGVQSLNALRRELDQITPAATSAALGGEDAGWTEKTLKRLSGLVSIRRTGDAAPDGSLDAALSDAEAALDAGDVVAAVAALRAVKGPSADALQPWLAKADARIAVEKALAALHVVAVSLMAPGEG